MGEISKVGAAGWIILIAIACGIGAHLITGWHNLLVSAGILEDPAYLITMMLLLIIFLVGTASLILMSMKGSKS